MNKLKQIKFQLLNTDSEVRINTLFDAWEYKEEGTKIVAQALKDRAIKVRQAALLLLRESETKIAKEALWDYLPFSKIKCLHTITELEFNSFETKNYLKTQEYHPDCFTIANYSDSLVTYWYIDYKCSGVAIWDLETGTLKQDYDLMAHEFGLGKNGKFFITSYQSLNFVYELETGKQINNDLDMFFSDINPSNGEFAVCKSDKTLMAKFHQTGYTGEFEIWNYENYSCLLNFQFSNLHLFTDNIPWSKKVLYITPLIFTPDGKFLIARFRDRKGQYVIKIWNTNTNQIIQTIDNLPVLTILSVGVRPNKTIIACGIREGKVCAWELQTDKIIFTTDEMCPCILSDNGRVLIYATASYEIVVRDLVKEQELCRLTGHNAPIAHLTLSEDYEFIASYSVDRQIKIWGMPNHDLG